MNKFDKEFVERIREMRNAGITPRLDEVDNLVQIIDRQITNKNLCNHGSPCCCCRLVKMKTAIEEALTL